MFFYTANRHTMTQGPLHTNLFSNVQVIGMILEMRNSQRRKKVAVKEKRKRGIPVSGRKEVNESVLKIRPLLTVV